MVGTPQITLPLEDVEGTGQHPHLLRGTFTDRRRAGEQGVPPGDQLLLHGVRDDRQMTQHTVVQPVERLGGHRRPHPLHVTLRTGEHAHGVPVDAVGVHQVAGDRPDHLRPVLLLPLVEVHRLHVQRRDLLKETDLRRALRQPCRPPAQQCTTDDHRVVGVVVLQQDAEVAFGTRALLLVIGGTGQVPQRLHPGADTLRRGHPGRVGENLALPPERLRVVTPAGETGDEPSGEDHGLLAHHLGLVVDPAGVHFGAGGRGGGEVGIIGGEYAAEGPAPELVDQGVMADAEILAVQARGHATGDAGQR